MIPVYKRKIAPAILFSFLTGGIWTLIWEYQLLKNVRAVKRDDSSPVGEFLCLVLVPFYSWYWFYTRGETVRNEFRKRGYGAKGSGAVYLILAICGLSIVALAILQHDFNSLPSADTASGAEGKGDEA
ncbi:MAG: DUF4234 domain-containing protein [Clostridia bacterium]|nr:DUF4234 domain-containing protein [Clostridia bacterium]